MSSLTDQLALIREKLNERSNSELEPTILAEGGVVQNWIRARRILVLVKRIKAQPTTPVPQSAIFVLQSTSFPISSKNDLSVENAFPIDLDFSIEIDTGDAAVLLKLVGGNNRRAMFEMLPGYHTQNFVAEVFRANEQTSSKSGTFNSDFSWLNPFTAASKGGPNLDDLTLNDVPDQMAAPTSASGSAAFEDEDDINRQEIAMGGAAPIAARESIVKYEMGLKEEQFTQLRTFSVFCGTYNVNGQSPPLALSSGAPVLSDWLAVDDEPPDLYAIGFQELDLSKEAFVFTESVKEEEWLNAVASSLPPKFKYVKVKLVRLVGMMLIVFVKEDLAQFIKNVSADTVGTGIMGKLGNKGGVAVRLDFHSTGVCFVNSHLAAHVSEFERRNQDFHDIVARMFFPGFNPPKAIKDHDMVFWLGDLNYRITDLDTTTVRELLKENQIQVLLEADQFKQQRHRRKVFTGYNEGEIGFIPTYKYDPGTDEWDSSEKARAPAWTDRVLWKGDHIRQQVYRSHMSLRISDHKPVSSLFEADMKVVDPAKYRRIYEEVMKKLDRLENEFLPQVTVDATEVVFETVKFIEPKAKTLTVANTGQVPVQYEFIKKLNDKSICKPWLAVEPSSGFIMPGDKSDIAIEVYVDKKTAGALTCGQDQPYDILVLHLVGGKDIFITVSGEYEKSVFGASINALCQMTVPIRELKPGTLLEYEKNNNTSDEKVETYPVPKELWFLCDLVSGLGLETEGLFLTPGLRKELLSLRDWLDSGLPVDKPKVSIHSAAEALLLFLESLREPIVPVSFYSRCLEVSANYLHCKQIVSQMPSHHRHVFNYVTAFLREALRHSVKNGVDPKIFASIFAGVFLRDPKNRPQNLESAGSSSGLRARAHQQLLDQKKARFIYHFLVNESDDL